MEREDEFIWKSNEIRQAVDKAIQIPQDWLTENEMRTINGISQITQQRMTTLSEAPNDPIE